jgi:hypothetical protein
MELTKMVDALGVLDQQIPWAWGSFSVSAGSRRRPPTAWPMPSELTSPAWDEPGRSIGFRALDDVTASDELPA